MTDSADGGWAILNTASFCPHSGWISLLFSTHVSLFSHLSLFWVHSFSQTKSYVHLQVRKQTVLEEEESTWVSKSRVQILLFKRVHILSWIQDYCNLFLRSSQIFGSVLSWLWEVSCDPQQSAQFTTFPNTVSCCTPHHSTSSSRICRTGITQTEK